MLLRMMPLSMQNQSQGLRSQVRAVVQLSSDRWRQRSFPRLILHSFTNFLKLLASCGISLGICVSVRQLVTRA